MKKKNSKRKSHLKKNITKKKVDFSLKASLSKTINSKPFLFMLRVVIVLSVLWYILYGLVMFTEQGYMITNTNAVEKDTSKVLVVQEGYNVYGLSDYVLLKGNDTLVFADGVEKSISDIEDYIRVVPGVNMWYIPDNHLVVSYLKDDLIKEGIPFYLVGTILFIIAILYAKKKKQVKETKLIGLSVVAFILSAFEFVVTVIYSYSFNWYSINYTNILFYGLTGYTLLKFLCIVCYNTKGKEVKSVS